MTECKDGDKRESELKYKIILVGDSKCGKTSLVTRYCDNVFIPIYDPTNGVEKRIHKTSSLNSEVSLEICDVSGRIGYLNNPQFDVRQNLEAANGIIYVYDVCSTKSFDNVKKWIYSIEEQCEPGVQRILVGTKTDLHAKRQVCRFEAEAIAMEHQMRFFEASAKSEYDLEIRNAFCILIYDMKMQYNKCSMEYFQIDDGKQEKKPIVKKVKKRLKYCCVCWPCFRRKKFKKE